MVHDQRNQNRLIWSPRKTSGTVVIGVGGGSNVLGTATGARWRNKPPNVTYYSSKASAGVSMALETEWLNNPGIVVGLAYALVTVYGHTGPIVIIEHGIAGSAYTTWSTTYAAELCNFAIGRGFRLNAVVEYLGSADAKAGGISVTNIETNVQTTMDRYRQPFGAGTPVVVMGCHTPESGPIDPDLDSVNLGMYNVCARQKLRNAVFVNNATLPIAGFGSDHLTGGIPLATDYLVQPAFGTPGGSDLAGQRAAAELHYGGLIP